MDEPALTVGIKCDVELNVLAPTERVASSWVAAALRRIADRLEKGEFEDGYHDVTDRSGKKLGRVYFDFYEEDAF